VAYICRKCGFTEIYTTGTEQIPVGKEHGTKIIEMKNLILNIYDSRKNSSNRKKLTKKYKDLLP
jgi:hypothetical protein